MNFSTILGILNQSIKSLRWWALLVILICTYLKYAPELYQPFISRASIAERSDLLGIIFVVAIGIFIVGWLAHGVDILTAKFEAISSRNAIRRARIAERRTERHKRRLEDRARQMKDRNIIRNLSATQLAMVKLALSKPNGILKVNNDAALDLATTLVTKNVFDRIRPWYNDHGGVIGEVFVVPDWVKSAVRELAIN